MTGTISHAFNLLSEGGVSSGGQSQQTAVEPLHFA